MEFDIEYLDLALFKEDKKKVRVIKEFSLNCYFHKKFNHIVYSENSQLNSVVNMLIFLGISLDKFDGQMHRINTHIHSSSIFKNKIFGDLVNNINYIWQHNNDIIGKLGQSNLRAFQFY